MSRWMASSGVPARPPARPPDDEARVRRLRFTALGSLIAVGAVLAAIVLTAAGGSGSHAPTTTVHRSTGPTNGRASASGTGKPGAASVPILAYRVVNAAPPNTTLPASLYVPAKEFSAQMDALKANGWHAVTLNQLQAYWARGVPLGPGKPIVITFDKGYASHYTNALPVLKRLGWVGVENLQVSGLSPADGGLADSQIRSLISAGWELDTDGVSQPDLTTLNSTQLSDEVAGARRTLGSRYGVNVNWFNYPSGNYDATVVAAVRGAGFVGSTTASPGWATPQEDRFRLPRLQVVAGTSPATLLSTIAAAQQAPPPPDSSHNPATA
jgi:peptidoglycan/xylan/chitin deacetylase (PgdA/CDA1 family)